MILPTMSDVEIREEIDKDLPEIIRLIDSKDKAYRREVLRRSVFPVYFTPVFHQSKTKNSWIILFEARSKKDIKDSRVCFICTMNSHHGLWAFMPTSTNGTFHLVIFQPHLFSRYRDRFKVNLNGTKLIAAFFRKNYSYVYERKERFVDADHYLTEVYGSTNDGVALGVSTVDGNVFFRTFVTYEMLKGEQIEVFTKNEQIRREIHETE